MRTYRVPQSDLTVSRIALGTGYLGGTWDRVPISATTLAETSRLLHTAHDQGITLFDLADIYCLGKSDLAVGTALRNAPGLRQRIVIQSKCGIRWHDDPPTSGYRRMDLSYDHIIRSVEGSLQRLNTEALDILLLHHPDPLSEPEEVANAFDRLHHSGKVRYFGVSNHGPSQIELLRKYLRQPLVINQVPLGLAHNDLISEGMSSALSVILEAHTPNISFGGGTLEYCRTNQIQIQAYSPLRGIPLKTLREPNLPPRLKRIAKALVDVTEEKHSTPAAIALGWLLSHPMGILPILGSCECTHLVENCEADRIQLSRDDWYTLWASAAHADGAAT